jgi:hypothetical protein
VHRLTFGEVCAAAVLIGAMLAGVAVTVLSHWVYDQAGDQ